MTGKITSYVCAALSIFSAHYLFAQSEGAIRVRYDTSRCDYCRMIFQDKSFGGELVTVGDSMLVFDATECLAAFLISEKIPLSSVKKVCSVNYGRPTMLADANTAWYLRSDKILSPMEAGLAAFASKQTADSVRVKLGGEVLTWKEVLNVIRARWFRKPQLK